MSKKNLITSLAPEFLERTQIFDLESSLHLLDVFYEEVRKELQRNESTTITALKDRDVVAVRFLADGFNLSLEYTEGGVL